MTAATYQRPTGTHLPSVTGSREPSPKEMAIICQESVNWYRSVRGALDAAQTKQQARALGDSLKNQITPHGLGRFSVAAFINASLTDENTVHHAILLFKALVKAEVLEPGDCPAVTHLVVRSSGSPPQQNPPTSSGTGTTTSPSPEPSSATPSFSFDKSADSRSAAAVRALAQSGKSLLILSSPEIDSHPIVLLGLYCVLRDETLIDPFELIRVFSPEGNQFLGLEGKEGIVGQVDVSPDSETASEFVIWLDFLWEAQRLLRLRRRQKQATPMARFAPTLFVFPDWDHWSQRWASKARIRKQAMALWIEDRQERDPNFVFRDDELHPTFILEEILRYGPSLGIRFLLSAVHSSIGKLTGITNASLPSFAVMAAGGAAQSGANFSACDQVLKLMDQTEAETVEPAYRAARVAAAKNGRNILLIRAHTPSVQALPGGDQLAKLRQTQIGRFNLKAG